MIQLVRDQKNIDLLTQAFPEEQSRLTLSAINNDEKSNAFAVSKEFVLVNSLNKLKMNNKEIELGFLDSLGLYINASKINSIEHKFIILVENLTVMANLSLIQLSNNINYLEDALWLYRGDVKEQQTTIKAYEFFRQFKDSHQLVCFADIDPAGIKIALSCGAQHILLPSASSVINFTVKDADKDFFNQTLERNFLGKQSDLSSSLLQLIDVMNQNRKTIKQEHILSHQIPLSMLDLRKK